MIVSYYVAQANEWRIKRKGRERNFKKEKKVY